MSKTGANSKSFLRETDFFEISPPFDEKDERLLRDILRKDDEGKLVHNKNKILRTLLNELKIDRHLIVNALHLQNYAVAELKEILADFRDYLEDVGLVGVLEMHPADGTQKSWHFHFWTNNDSTDAYNVLRNYVVRNGYANEKNVDIQGKFQSFLDNVDHEDKHVQEYVKLKRFNDRWTNENTPAEVRIGREKELYKTKKKAPQIDNAIKVAMDINSKVKPINEVALSEEQVEIRDIKHDIFAMLNKDTKESNDAFVREQHSNGLSYQERLSKIPKADVEKRLKEIKLELDKVNKRSKK